MVTLLIENLPDLVEDVRTQAIQFLTGEIGATDDTPTKLELDTMLGTADTVEMGTQYLIKSLSGSGLLFLVATDGSDWSYVALTKAV